MQRLMYVALIFLLTAVKAHAALTVKQDGIVYTCTTDAKGNNVATVKDYDYLGAYNLATYGKAKVGTIVIPHEVYYVNSNGDTTVYYMTSVNLSGKDQSAKRLGDFASNVVISEGITQVNSVVSQSAFQSITLPYSFKSFGNYYTSATHYYFPNGNPYHKIVDGIMYNADMTILEKLSGFNDTTFTVPASVTTMQVMPKVAHLYFEEGSKLTGITTLANYTGTEITIPKSCTTIPGVTNYSNTIQKVYFEDDTIVAGKVSIDGIIYNKDTTSVFFIPRGRKGNVYLPNKLTSLGDFSTLSSNLDTVFIGDNVKSLGQQFSQSAGASVPLYHVSGANPYFCSDEIGAIYSKDKKTIYRFPTANKYKVNSYTLPANITTIGSHAFQSSGIREVYIDHDVAWGVAAFCWSNSQLQKLVIGNGVTKLGNSAFAFCSKLTDVTIGDDVKTIDEQCFHGASALVSINLNNVTTIGSHGFSKYGGSKLASVIAPKVTTIGASAFNGCSNLKFIDLQNVTSLGNYAFEYSGLQRVNIGDIQSLGTGVFYHANSLTTVLIGNNVKSLPTDVFYGCDKFHTLSFIDGLDSLANNALTGLQCDSIFTIVFPESMKYLGEQNFDGFNNLKDVWINSAANLGNAVSAGRTGTKFHYAYKNRNVKDIDALSESASEEGVWTYSETLQNKGYNKKDKLYYGTFYLDRSYIVPKGVTMYTVNGATYSTYDAADGTDIFSLNLVKYEAGSTVPAGTAVIATTSDNLELQFDIATGSAAKAEAEEVNNTAMTISDIYLGGFMKDSLIEQQPGYRYYKLTTADDDPGDYSTLGFYGDANTDSCGAFVSKAQKAFLAVQYTNYLQGRKQAATGVSGAKFMFNINNATDADAVEDNNTTAITEVTTDTKPAVKGMYNLGGQKVQGNYNGIIITNGKKVIK
jgi:hypothetical protein